MGVAWKHRVSSSGTGHVLVHTLLHSFLEGLTSTGWQARDGPVAWASGSRHHKDAFLVLGAGVLREIGRFSPSHLQSWGSGDQI